MYTLRSNILSFHVTGIRCGWKNVKNIGMGVRKGTVVSFVPTLFGYFLGIPYLLCLFIFLNVFCDFIYNCTQGKALAYELPVASTMLVA